MTTRTRKLRPHPSNRGLTLVEVIAVVVVIGTAVALAIGAAQPRTQKAANIAKCANNLRLLAAAAHCYADDFGEKFIYDWGRAKTLDGKDHGEPKRWWDEERVGRYVQGHELQWYPSMTAYRRLDTGEIVDALKRPYVNDAGLGGRALTCPSEDATRSYHMNFWASGIEIPDRMPEDLTPFGQFFDRNTPGSLSRLILVGEMLGLYAGNQEGSRKPEWITGGEFGAAHLPGIRFSGVSRPRAFGYRTEYARWGMPGSFPVSLDYTRHSDSAIYGFPAVGRLNFSFADGHVEFVEHSGLYDAQTRRSTYQVLWSPVDQALESKEK